MKDETVKLMKRLEKYPHLIARMEVLLDATENTDGDLELAKDAEEKIYEEITRMGNELLTAWGTGQELKKRKIIEEKPGAIKHGKKKLTG